MNIEFKNIHMSIPKKKKKNGLLRTQDCKRYGIIQLVIYWQILSSSFEIYSFVIIGASDIKPQLYSKSQIYAV